MLIPAQWQEIKSGFRHYYLIYTCRSILSPWVMGMTASFNNFVVKWTWIKQSPPPPFCVKKIIKNQPPLNSSLQWETHACRFIRPNIEPLSAHIHVLTGITGLGEVGTAICISPTSIAWWKEVTGTPQISPFSPVANPRQLPTKPLSIPPPPPPHVSRYQLSMKPSSTPYQTPIIPTTKYKTFIYSLPNSYQPPPPPPTPPPPFSSLTVPYRPPCFQEWQVLGSDSTAISSSLINCLQNHSPPPPPPTLTSSSPTVPYWPHPCLQEWQVLG